MNYDKNLMGENSKQSINSVIACRAGSGCPYMDEEPWTVFALYRRDIFQITEVFISYFLI